MNQEVIATKQVESSKIEPIAPNLTVAGSFQTRIYKIVIVALLLLLVLVGFAAYYIGSKNTGDNDNLPSNVTPSQAPITSITPAQSQENTTWKTYASAEGNFSMQYPPEVTEGEKDGFVHFSQTGPTQNDLTQFDDGINVLIKQGYLNQEIFSNFVNQEVTNSQQNGEILEYPKEVVIAGRTGLRYKAQGLGSFTYYYLPMKDGNYLQIIDGTVDPTGKGYLQIVDKMLSTISFRYPVGFMPKQRGCRDYCGDGMCNGNEFNCMSLACVCGETKKSCPEDCK